jgi:5-formyltetrahydrofolate cyclo-ligase
MMVPPTLQTESGMDRSALRSAARKTRNAAASSASHDSAWPSELVQTLSRHKCIAGYWPVGSEISPIEPLLKMASEGHTVCLPYFKHRDSAMLFRCWNTEIELEDSPFGFAQPGPTQPEVEPDCLLVPLLAFDRYGNRIGQGGGHYDRYFASFPNNLRIGVAWWQQERSDLVQQLWDVQMNMIATNREWIECSPKEKGQK